MAMKVSQLRDEASKCEAAKDTVESLIEGMDFEELDRVVCDVVQLAEDTGAEHTAAGECAMTYIRTYTAYARQKCRRY